MTVEISRSSQRREQPEGGGGLGADLRRVPAEEELAVQYQPVVLPEDRVVVGLEAFARWRRPDGRLLPAGDFLSLARQVGFTVEMDRRMIAMTARDVARCSLLPSLEWVSLNLASSSLRHPEVVEGALSLVEDLRRFDLRLVVELSERASDADDADPGAGLSRLRRVGAGVALDHFGAGRSSFGRRLDFPVDFVKVDAPPPGAASHGGADPEGFTRALVKLGRAVGRQVILTGVGEVPGRGTLVDEVDCAQGFGFGRPRLAEDLARAG